MMNMAMKTLLETMRNEDRHWVGDGFPVRSLFSYQGDTRTITPFLLFDYAGLIASNRTKARRGGSASIRTAGSRP
jgi:redox-sensitive bicupin YhaK (pirin superfamily)